MSQWRLPGLAVDAAGDKAYVIAPDGSAVKVDLATLAVSHHHLTHQRSLLARLDNWLQPSANAKGDSGPIRHAQWLGDGLLLVAGSNMHDTRTLASDPSGLELVDTRSWTAQTIDPRADSFAVADGLLLATGTRWRGNTNPTGMGLAAYGRDAKRRFALLPGRDVWLDTTLRDRPPRLHRHLRPEAMGPRQPARRPHHRPLRGTADSAAWPGKPPRIAQRDPLHSRSATAPITRPRAPRCSPLRCRSGVAVAGPHHANKRSPRATPKTTCLMLQRNSDHGVAAHGCEENVHEVFVIVPMVNAELDLS